MSVRGKGACSCCFAYFIAFAHPLDELLCALSHRLKCEFVQPFSQQTRLQVISPTLLRISDDAGVKAALGRNRLKLTIFGAYDQEDAKCEWFLVTETPSLLLPRG